MVSLVIRMSFSFKCSNCDYYKSNLKPGYGRGVNGIDELRKKNIFLRKIGTRSEMIDELKDYRALTYLGHKSDIFTLTAEEAVKLCLPVITLGTGSLKERVTHNETGFIANSDQEFANYTINLLNDDAFYLDLKTKMHKKRKENNWEQIANHWIQYFLNE